MPILTPDEHPVAPPDRPTDRPRGNGADGDGEDHMLYRERARAVRVQCAADSRGAPARSRPSCFGLVIDF